MSSDEIDYLSLDDLLEIAAGVLPVVEIRDKGLLAGAASRPRSSAFGADAYPSFPEKVAALLHSIARNHALVDGNKRLAWSAARVFCLMNGRDLELDVDEAEAMVIGAAAGTLDVPALATIVGKALRTAEAAIHDHLAVEPDELVPGPGEVHGGDGEDQPGDERAGQEPATERRAWEGLVAPPVGGGEPRHTEHVREDVRRHRRDPDDEARLVEPEHDAALRAEHDQRDAAQRTAPPSRGRRAARAARSSGCGGPSAR